MLSKVKAFMFDLDGTLIQSAVDFVKLKRETIRRLSELQVPTDELSEKMKTYEIMAKVRQLTASGKLDLSYPEIVAETTLVWNRVELETVRNTERIPGAERALIQLRSKGMRIGVITRGCGDYAAKALRTTRLFSLVDIIIGRDDTVEAKPNPEPLLRAMSRLGVEAPETVMIGDSVDDAACAHKAGVAFIGVLTGLSDATALKRIGCIRVLKSVEDLTTLLED
ncbi:HAD family hydrolase [Candidatus Bathyarchaeota archaeon]|nr:HAD family hydrolase [Candidatus Bathyarchaeota archaeon]